MLAGIATDSQPKHLAKSCDTGKITVIPSPTCSPFLLQLSTVPASGSLCLVSLAMSQPLSSRLLFLSPTTLRLPPW